MCVCVCVHICIYVWGSPCSTIVNVFNDDIIVSDFELV